MGSWPPSPVVEDEATALANECGLSTIAQDLRSDDHTVPSRGSVDQYPIICDSTIHTDTTAPATNPRSPSKHSFDAPQRTERPCLPSVSQTSASRPVPPSDPESRGRPCHADTKAANLTTPYASRSHSATRFDHSTESRPRPTISRVHTDLAGELQSMQTGTRREPSPYSYTRETRNSQIEPITRSKTEQFLSPIHATESPVSIQRSPTHQEYHKDIKESDSSTDSEKSKPKKSLRFADEPLGPAHPPPPRKSFSLPDSRPREEGVQNIELPQPTIPQESEHRRHHHHHHRRERVTDASTDVESEAHEQRSRNPRSSSKVRESPRWTSTEESVPNEHTQPTRELAATDRPTQHQGSHRREKPRLEEPFSQMLAHARKDSSDDDTLKRVYRIRDLKSPMTPPSVTTPTHMEDYFGQAFRENALRHSNYTPRSSNNDATVFSPPNSPPRTPRSERRGRSEYCESPSSSPHRTPRGSRPPSLEESQIRDLKAHHSLLSQATAGAAAVAAKISPLGSRSSSGIETGLDAPNHVIVTKSRSRASSPVPVKQSHRNDPSVYAQPRSRASSPQREATKPIVHRADSISYVQPRSRAPSPHREMARSTVRADPLNYEKPRSRAPSPQREALTPIVHRADSTSYNQPRSRASSPQRVPLKPAARSESVMFDAPRSGASSPQREALKPIIRTDSFTHGDFTTTRVYNVSAPQVRRPSTRDGTPTSNMPAYPPPQPQRTASFTAFEPHRPHSIHFQGPPHTNIMSNILPSSSLKVPPPPPLLRSQSASTPVEVPRRHDEFALPACPRSQPTQGLRDWVTLRDLPHFDVCPKCAHTLAATRYRGLLIRSLDKPYNRSTVCAMSRPWVRIAITQCVKRNKMDLSIIRDANTLAMGARPCEGVSPDLRQWFRVPDSTTDRVVPDFLVCSACLGSIHAVYPELRDAFSRDVLNQEGICDLRCSSKDFHLFTEQIEKIAAKCRDREFFQPRYMQPLVEAIKRVSRPHHHIGCPRDRMLPNRAWHYPDVLPEFAICEACFEQAVWPVKDKPFAYDISKAMKIAPASTYKGCNPVIAASNGMHPVSCQLYSERSRRLFSDVVNGQITFDVFKNKVRERQAAQYRLVEMNRMYEEDQKRGWDRRGEIERNWAYWRSVE